MRALLPLAMLLAACGARSGLSWDRPDASVDAAAGCLRSSECDDGLDCTADRCERGTCVHEPLDVRCNDGLFCTGIESCDPALGCVASGSPCADAVECTEDSCDERREACEHAPNAELCPVSHRCDDALGCVARALVHADRRLFEIDLPSGERHLVGPTDVTLTDLALHPDGRVFGVTSGSLFLVDYERGSSTFIASLPDRPVALELGPDGLLYVAGSESGRVIRVDPASGAVEPFASLPAGQAASGDIAFVSGRVLITTSEEPDSRVRSNALYEIPLEGGEARRVGDIGSPCVWGVAAFGETLYGFTCRGELVLIDVSTAAGTVLRGDIALEMGGAAAR
jgi:hypothetical protein